jgi:hypothetical protein
VIPFLIIAFVAFFLLWWGIFRVWGDDSVQPLTPPRTKTLIIAGSYAQACYHMKQENVSHDSWRYLAYHEDYIGYGPGTEVRLVGEWWKSPIVNDDYGLRYLVARGLRVTSPYEEKP